MIFNRNRVLIALLWACTAWGAAAQDKNTAAIRRMMDEQVVQWNQGNTEGFMQGYWKSDSLTFIGSRGITRGWNTVLRNYQSSYSDPSLMGRLSFTDMEFDRLSPSCYRVTGSWHIEREKPVSGWFTLIVKKIKKAWKIVYDHSS